MNIRPNPINAAMRNLQARQQGMQVPRGAQYAAIAGQQQGQALQRQPQRQAQGPGGLQLSPQIQAKMAQMQGLQVPQGAQAGNLAGCGDGDCMDIGYAPPFAGIPNAPSLSAMNGALMPVVIPFTDAAGAAVASVTVSISCGNSLFYGCCARTFNGPGEAGFTSMYSGSSNEDLLCVGSGPLDVSYFNTNGNQCCCEFDFGCFSSFFPLIIEAEVIGTPSVAAPVNMVIGGSKLTGGNACSFWPGFAGFGGPIAPM